MKASKEVRMWVNRRRKEKSKSNGVVPWLWDAPEVEVRHDKNKNNYRRNRLIPHTY